MSADTIDNSGEQILWQKYWVAEDPVARTLLIERFTYIPKKISAALFRKRPDDDIEFEEYFQFGLVGLIEAIDRYQRDKGVNFETYATYRIRGAILNGIEKLTERRSQIACKQLLRKERLESLKRRSNEEMNDLFIEMADVAIGLALGYLLEDSGLYRDQEKITEDTTYKTNELSMLKRSLKQVLNYLSKREQRVIHYHYFENKDFKAIADQLEISKGRISQIHKQALKHLREKMANQSFESYF